MNNGVSGSVNKTAEVTHASAVRPLAPVPSSISFYAMYAKRGQLVVISWEWHSVPLYSLFVVKQNHVLRVEKCKRFSKYDNKECWLETFALMNYCINIIMI